MINQKQECVVLIHLLAFLFCYDILGAYFCCKETPVPTDLCLYLLNLLELGFCLTVNQLHVVY